MELLSAMLASFSKGGAVRVRISNMSFVADVQDLHNGMVSSSWCQSIKLCFLIKIPEVTRMAKFLILMNIWMRQRSSFESQLSCFYRASLHPPPPPTPSSVALCIPVSWVSLQLHAEMQCLECFCECVISSARNDESSFGQRLRNSALVHH